jgi:hypothetical protein
VGVDAPDLTPQRRLALCTEVKVACLDLQPALPPPAATSSGHARPDARGHAVAARAIAAALAS